MPITFQSAHGAHLVDVDGNQYVDFALGFGPMILGHSPASVVEAIQQQAQTGIGFGANHPGERDLAELICRLVPSADLCAFSSTGTESVQVAIRVARAATHRPRIVKCLGHYHGWSDSVYVGVSPLTDHSPATGGQDPRASELVTLCEWNDMTALEEALSDDVAAVIMEPAAINCGALAPKRGYLEAVRELTRKAGSLLIFDEVITGFRLALGGAQEVYGVTPDLTVLGKALGGGLPISAVCGRADVMEVLVDGTVGHVGTFNANAVCAAAAGASVREYERLSPYLYEQLARRADELSKAFVEAGREAGVPLTVNCIGGAAYGFVSDRAVTTYREALATDTASYRRFAKALLDEGVHVIPRGLLYVSAAHTDADMEFTAQAARRAAARVASGEVGQRA
ncbi:MAG: aspartate aminotransferase family protein [Candidatus Dormibacteraeota bacterium]|nr:aspartate aminotransferase family protein [Candidatus Dormibacteraeota bacterium]